MLKIFKTQDGFTLIEIISVLVVLGILTVVAVSRMTNYDIEVRTGADALKAHLCYAQTVAMNYSPNAGEDTVWGIKSNDGTSYWLFKGTSINDPHFLPDDSKYVASDGKINLTAKKIKLNAGFTIYYDNHGIPYTAYTDSTPTGNTPLAGDLTIVVTPLSGSPSQNITITPLTGFIQ